jgi:adenylate cyclase class 2
MSHSGQEREAKFFVSGLEKFSMRLHELKAHLIQPRVLETNIRFDLPDGSLRASSRVLRLRQDTEAHLTYKSGGQNHEGVLARQEIEMIVEDFDKALQLLEGLGFQKSMYYEKYRTTYRLENVLVMLDEMPFGNFVEVEGETADQIRAISTQLDLEWTAAIGAGYTALFETVRKSLNLPFQDISFGNFEGINVTSDDLNVTAADKRRLTED